MNCSDVSEVALICSCIMLTINQQCAPHLLQSTSSTLILSKREVRRLLYPLRYDQEELDGDGETS